MSDYFLSTDQLMEIKSTALVCGNAFTLLSQDDPAVPCLFCEHNYPEIFSLPQRIKMADEAKLPYGLGIETTYVPLQDEPFGLFCLNISFRFKQSLPELFFVSVIIEDSPELQQTLQYIRDTEYLYVIPEPVPENTEGYSATDFINLYMQDGAYKGFFLQWGDKSKARFIEVFNHVRASRS